MYVTIHFNFCFYAQGLKFVCTDDPRVSSFVRHFQLFVCKICRSVRNGEHWCFFQAVGSPSWSMMTSSVLLVRFEVAVKSDFGSTGPVADGTWKTRLMRHLVVSLLSS